MRLGDLNTLQVTKTLANREHISRIKRQLQQLDNTAEKQAGLNFGNTWCCPSLFFITPISVLTIATHSASLFDCFVSVCNIISFFPCTSNIVKLRLMVSYFACILCFCLSFFNLWCIECFFAYNSLTCLLSYGVCSTANDLFLCVSSLHSDCIHFIYCAYQNGISWQHHDLVYYPYVVVTNSPICRHFGCFYVALH